MNREKSRRIVRGLLELTKEGRAEWRNLSDPSDHNPYLSNTTGNVETRIAYLGRERVSLTISPEGVATAQVEPQETWESCMAVSMDPEGNILMEEGPDNPDVRALAEAATESAKDRVARQMTALRALGEETENHPELLEALPKMADALRRSTAEGRLAWSAAGASPGSVTHVAQAGGTRFTLTEQPEAAGRSSIRLEVSVDGIASGGLESTDLRHRTVLETLLEAVSPKEREEETPEQSPPPDVETLQAEFLESLASAA